MHPTASSWDDLFVPRAAGPAATLLGAAASRNWHAGGDRTRWERFSQHPSSTISHPARSQGCSHEQPSSPSISLTSPFQGQAARRSRPRLGSPRGPGTPVSPSSQNHSRRQQPCLSAQGCSGSSEEPPTFSSGWSKSPAQPRNPPASQGAKKELKCSKKLKPSQGRARVHAEA